jgi:hypothetical protein
MRKLVTVVLLMAVLIGSIGTVSAVNQDRGGLMGFIAGCCFGLRTGGAYNDGKEVHWREWVMLIPIANVVFAIWNGIDGANGMTTKDYAAQYGSAFY